MRRVVRAASLPRILFDYALAEAKNRETSKLVLLDDNDYFAGLGLMEGEAESLLGKLVDPGLMLANWICTKTPAS